MSVRLDKLLGIKRCFFYPDCKERLGKTPDVMELSDGREIEVCRSCGTLLEMMYKVREHAREDEIPGQVDAV